MPVEKKEVKTDTHYRVAVGSFGSLPLSSNLGISVSPAISSPNTCVSVINITPRDFHSNNVLIGCANLCLVMKNHLKDIDFEINDDGELVVHAADADNYSIDNNGNLIYTFNR